MAGKAAKRRYNQTVNSQKSQNAIPTCIIPIANIKTEPVDDASSSKRAKTTNQQTAKSTTTIANPLQITIKTEKPDGHTTVRTNSTINIKTERPDDDSDSVIFVPNPPTAVIKINNSPVPPPQKKTRLNNGRSRANPQNFANIKREIFSPTRRNRAARFNNNHQRPRNNTGGNYRNGFNNRHNNSERILQSIQLSPTDIRLLMQEQRQRIADLFNFLWFQAETEQITSVERLIVAKISAGNHSNFQLEHVYRDMRRDMVGWIERYQADWGGKTPIYHNAFIEKPSIIVLCNDTEAYEYLAEYIKYTYRRHVEIEYLPSYAGRTLYVYAATADDLIYDIDRFLAQIHFHMANRSGRAVNANKWILVRHRIHMADGITSFVFFMDYTSSLTLEYVYKNSLNICMLDVKFAYRGIAPCNF